MSLTTLPKTDHFLYTMNKIKPLRLELFKVCSLDGSIYRLTPKIVKKIFGGFMLLGLVDNVLKVGQNWSIERSFKGHFVTQKGQISKSSKYHCVIHQKKGMEETNTFVIFLGQNIHLISNKCRSNVYVTYLYTSQGPKLTFTGMEC